MRGAQFNIQPNNSAAPAITTCNNVETLIKAVTSEIKRTAVHLFYAEEMAQNTEFMKEQAALLGDFLKTNSTLNYIALVGSPFSKDSWEAIANALDNSDSITNIDTAPWDSSLSKETEEKFTVITTRNKKFLDPEQSEIRALKPEGVFIQAAQVALNEVVEKNPSIYFPKAIVKHITSFIDNSFNKALLNRTTEVSTQVKSKFKEALQNRENEKLTIQNHPAVKQQREITEAIGKQCDLLYKYLIVTGSDTQKLEMQLHTAAEWQRLKDQQEVLKHKIESQQDEGIKESIRVLLAHVKNARTLIEFTEVEQVGLKIGELPQALNKATQKYKDSIDRRDALEKEILAQQEIIRKMQTDAPIPAKIATKVITARQKHIEEQQKLIEDPRGFIENFIVTQIHSQQQGQRIDINAINSRLISMQGKINSYVEEKRRQDPETKDHYMSSLQIELLKIHANSYTQQRNELEDRYKQHEVVINQLNTINEKIIKQRQLIVEQLPVQLPVIRTDLPTAPPPMPRNWQRAPINHLNPFLNPFLGAAPNPFAPQQQHIPPANLGAVAFPPPPNPAVQLPQWAQQPQGFQQVMQQPFQAQQQPVALPPAQQQQQPLAIQQQAQQPQGQLRHVRQQMLQSEAFPLPPQAQQQQWQQVVQNVIAGVQAVQQQNAAQQPIPPAPPPPPAGQWRQRTQPQTPPQQGPFQGGEGKTR
jgi:hypothetical protein